MGKKIKRSAAAKIRKAMTGKDSYEDEEGTYDTSADRAKKHTDPEQAAKYRKEFEEADEKSKKKRKKKKSVMEGLKKVYPKKKKKEEDEEEDLW